MPTSEREPPTFTIMIEKCKFEKLSVEQLVKKLDLMVKIGFTRYYTIKEDPVQEPPIT